MKIVHVLRAPVGGLFRHVRDLSREQAARGHEVGAVCDISSCDSLTERRLSQLAPVLSLGLERVAMARDIDLRDFTATRATSRIAERMGADVVHGHGAKGGAYARLAAAGLKRGRNPVVAVYTPHGGSLHYAPSSLKGRVFMGLERYLARATDGIVFESAYAAKLYAGHVAPPVPLKTRIIPNGIAEEEFEPILPDTDAADFLFVGELRRLKGVDLLIEALAMLDSPFKERAVIVGEGPDQERFRAQAAALGLSDRIRFAGAIPAREAFKLGRTLIMPSRAESLPYIVLEAAAAGLPMIATDVGGVSEIVAGTQVQLVPSEDVVALANAMQRHLAARDETLAVAADLRSAVARRFTVGAMATSTLDFYSELAGR